MWIKVVESGVTNRGRGFKPISFEAPVVSETDTEKNGPNEPESTAFATASTSLVVVALVAAITKRSPGTSRAHVSRKSSTARRRKGTDKSPGGIQARDQREICAEVLHHKSGRKYCSSVALRGMGADRTEAGGALDFQSDEEKVPDAHELLRAGRGDGRAGAPADPADSARVGADSRGSGSAWQSDLPGSSQPGSA